MMTYIMIFLLAVSYFFYKIHKYEKTIKIIRKITTEQSSNAYAVNKRVVMLEKTNRLFIDIMSGKTGKIKEYVFSDEISGIVFKRRLVLHREDIFYDKYLITKADIISLKNVALLFNLRGKIYYLDKTIERDIDIGLLKSMLKSVRRE